MKYSAIAFLLILLGCGSAQSEFGQIPKANQIQIDGNASDWASISSLILSSSDSTITEGKGSWIQDDLKVTVQSAWDEEALYVAAIWEDNVIDTIDIPLDSVLWTGHPDGLRRDKMYFYDNLAIRLRLPDYFGYWLTPGNMDHGGFQHAETIKPSTAIQQIDARTFFIESKVLWREMGYTPVKGDSINFQIIASDSDQPSSTLLEKNNATRYLLWTQDVVFNK